MAPAILAVGAATLFTRTGRDRWLIAAGLLVAFSLLLKPVTLAVCVPVGLAILLRPERRLRNRLREPARAMADRAEPTRPTLAYFPPLISVTYADRAQASMVLDGRNASSDLGLRVRGNAGRRRL